MRAIGRRPKPRKNRLMPVFVLINHVNNAGWFVLGG
jgi:hypothetical protein